MVIGSRCSKHHRHTLLRDESRIEMKPVRARMDQSDASGIIETVSPICNPGSSDDHQIR